MELEHFDRSFISSSIWKIHRQALFVVPQHTAS
jgi:hypothetical protein